MPAHSTRSDAPIVRLAMWSGPRNISTAMLRSWGSRRDAIVCDEPLYARWLKATGTDHPARAETLAACETDLARIVAWLTRAPLPEGKRIFYQKHMAHHLLEGDDLSWTTGLTNAFLIREPARVIASYVKIVPNPSLRDLGYAQQAALFARERERLGENPLVLDAADVLRDPRGMLSALCHRVGVAFDEAMLSWEKGPRATDGAWGKHWYARVYDSTGFAPPTDEPATVAARYAPLARACESMCETLREARLTPMG